jgi:hypothetical protein
MYLVRKKQIPAAVGMTSGDAVNAVLKALLHPKASSVVPTPFGFAQGRLFEKREEWGTVVGGDSAKVKGVGQECPTHTGIAQGRLVQTAVAIRGMAAAIRGRGRPRHTVTAQRCHYPYRQGVLARPD